MVSVLTTSFRTPLDPYSYIEYETLGFRWVEESLGMFKYGRLVEIKKAVRFDESAFRRDCKEFGITSVSIDDNYIAASFMI